MHNKAIIEAGGWGLGWGREAYAGEDTAAFITGSIELLRTKASKKSVFMSPAGKSSEVTKHPSPQICSKVCQAQIPGVGGDSGFALSRGPWEVR